MIGFHGSLGGILFLLTPFAVNDALVRTKLLRSMARSEEKVCLHTAALCLCS